MFIVGVLLGGFIASQWLASDMPVLIWHSLLTLRGLVMLVGGGVLVGFGTAYAGGCTSGHAISGLADLQLPSPIAVVGLFAGGLITTWFILPALL